MKKGRWQLERERHHIARETPILGVREPTPLASVISPVVKSIITFHDTDLEKIEQKWETFAGKDFAPHCKPGRFENGRLTIFVDNAVWLNELKRYRKKIILSQLQEFLGKDKITDVIFRLDPGERKKT